MRVEVTQGTRRSLEQNRRYFAMLREIASQVWVGGKQYSDEVWHEMLKQKFIGHVDGPDGKKYGMSTSKLSVSEFTRYMDEVEKYAIQELGWVPD